MSKKKKKKLKFPTYYDERLNATIQVVPNNFKIKKLNNTENNG